nr:NAD-dependent epimerase/dehydratase family protein [Elusimicrobiota bacterium]
ILVTGAAGFIGSWVCKSLRDRGDNVIGLDDFNDYYDVSLKRARVRRFIPGVKVYKADVADRRALERIFHRHRFRQVCHLAAQAGVRYSLQNPFAYESANVLGSLNLLEMCRRFGVRSFIYASSSSVYGGNKKVPFSVRDRVDRPLSLYAATKRAGELMAHVYHRLYGISCTGLRFFTVYGPWGRPDMALFKFTRAILRGRPIDVYNYGRMERDFTYVTDIAAGVLAALDKNYPFEIFNLGNSRPVRLRRFIGCLEKELGRRARMRLLPLQPGDVPRTCADLRETRRKLGYRPRVPVEKGIREFVRWYKDYYRPA